MKTTILCQKKGPGDISCFYHLFAAENVKRKKQFWKEEGA